MSCRIDRMSLTSGDIYSRATRRVEAPPNARVAARAPTLTSRFIGIVRMQTADTRKEVQDVRKRDNT